MLGSRQHSAWWLAVALFGLVAASACRGCGCGSGDSESGEQSAAAASQGRAVADETDQGGGEVSAEAAAGSATTTGGPAQAAQAGSAGSDPAQLPPTPMTPGARLPVVPGSGGPKVTSGSKRAARTVRALRQLSRYQQSRPRPELPPPGKIKAKQISETGKTRRSGPPTGALPHAKHKKTRRASP